MRNAYKYLLEWKMRHDRKPLVIRGARQVGKTYLINQFGSECYKNFLRLDFEKNANLFALFKTNDPKTIIENLALIYNVDLLADHSLLFLDEIQACPEAFSSLRYFFEEIPSLHIVAAGSLLDILLDDPQFSMPVGRVEFLYLYPLRFDEFLEMLGESRLVSFLKTYQLGQVVTDIVHEKLSQYFRKFLFIGGMPEAVSKYAATGSYVDAKRIHSSILDTYENDFSKYKKRVSSDVLKTCFNYAIKNIGHKVKYTEISHQHHSLSLKNAIKLLSLARVIHIIRHSSANGIPLAAEESEAVYKLHFLDVALVYQSLGLEIITMDDAETVLEGRIAEQIVAQEMLSDGLPFARTSLHYWLREQRTSNAEVDFVVSVHNEIIPIEVKAGKSGKLKSLHIFLAEKNRKRAVRFWAKQPCMDDLTQTVTFSAKDQRTIQYRLLNLPLYLSGQLFRLLQDWKS